MLLYHYRRLLLVPGKIQLKAPDWFEYNTYKQHHFLACLPCCILQRLRADKNVMVQSSSYSQEQIGVWEHLFMFAKL